MSSTAKRVSNALEQPAALTFGRIVLAIRRSRKPLEQLALVVVEVARHKDVDHDVEIASPLALQGRQALATHANDRPRLGSRLQLGLLVAFECRECEHRSK